MASNYPTYQGIYTKGKSFHLKNVENTLFMKLVILKVMFLI